MIPHLIKRAVYRTLGSENYFLAKALYQLGRGYENSYQNFLHLLPVGARLLDIGANIGVTTAYARRKRPDLKVVAFEPLPFNLAAAKRLCSILHIQNVDFHEVALGDSTGIAEMIVPTLDQLPAPAQSHVVHDRFSYPSWLDERGERLRVPLAMIDSLELPQVDGIKLDVENFEWQVLRGAIHLLKRDHPVIYCELWDTPNRREVIGLLGDLGYSFEKLDTKEDFLFRWNPLTG